MPQFPPLFAAGDFIVNLILLFVVLFGGWIIRAVAQFGQRQFDQQRAKDAARPPRPIRPPQSDDAAQMRDFLGRPDDFVEAVLIDDSPLGAGVATSVASHISTTEFAERASHLGEDLGQADERLDARLQATFDHRVGSLSDSSDAVHEKRPPETEEKPAVAAADIAAALANPQNLLQAIVLSEILARPEDRWG